MRLAFTAANLRNAASDRGRNAEIFGFAPRNLVAAELLRRASRVRRGDVEGAFGVTHRPEILLTMVRDTLAQGREE